MENKYKEGETVFDRSRPQQKLIVCKYFNKVYYCQIEENHNKRLAYFERELISSEEKQAKNGFHLHR
jgi:hypothetical protein